MSPSLCDGDPTGPGERGVVWADGVERCHAGLGCGIDILTVSVLLAE
jgi:hypothetical protein